jgi:hypothetical protein
MKREEQIAEATRKPGRRLAVLNQIRSAASHRAMACYRSCGRLYARPSKIGSAQRNPSPPLTKISDSLSCNKTCCGVSEPDVQGGVLDTLFLRVDCLRSWSNFYDAELLVPQRPKADLTQAAKGPSPKAVTRTRGSGRKVLLDHLSALLEPNRRACFVDLRGGVVVNLARVGRMEKRSLSECGSVREN